MKRAWSSLACLFVGLALGLLVARGLAIVRYQTTQTSLSPDEHYRVRILDRAFPSVDRNFEVGLERRDDGSESTIFRSPDEDPPPGRERIAWSEDGTRFVIFGRGFIVHEAAKTDGDAVLYLMVDVVSGRVWCNSNQQTAYPPFTCKDLPPMRWGGPCPPPARP